MIRELPDYLVLLPVHQEIGKSLPAQGELQGLRIGLVTKNGILIVEFANQLKERGRPVRLAIVEAAEARLRPILMTSLAISLGALPIAMAFGAAATSRIGMGVVIVGGTLFSLILTLYIIPAVYAMWSREYKPNCELEEAKRVEEEVMAGERLL